MGLLEPEGLQGQRGGEGRLDERGGGVRGQSDVETGVL